MSQGRAHSDATELLRRWQGLVVPVEEQEQAAARRERMIGRVGGFIRQAASQQRRQRVRRRVVAGVAMAAAVCLGVGALASGSSGEVAQRGSVPAAGVSDSRPVAVLQVVDGTVVAGSQVVGSQAPTRLRPGDQVSTAADGRAVLRLSGQAEVVLGGATRLRIVETQLSEQRLLLQSGRVDVDVPEQAPDQQLAILTPDAEVHVIGTAFSVELLRAEDSSAIATRVDVSRGEVRVIRRGFGPRSVSAGARWVSNEEVARQPECAGDAAMAPPTVARSATARQDAARRSELAAQNRTYQAALDARNAGDDARALRLLERFLARYPASPLVQEAQVERFRTLRRMGRGRDAAREARRYLSDHASGYAREEARELVLPPTSERSPTGR